MALFLFFGAVGHHDRRAHAMADDVEERRPVWCHLVESVVDSLLEMAGHPEPALAFGEVHPGQAEIELGAHELITIPMRVVFLEQLVEQ